MLQNELTYDGGGLDGVHHFLQGLQVRMVVGKLLLLMVQVPSALKKHDHDNSQAHADSDISITSALIHYLCINASGLQSHMARLGNVNLMQT